MPSASQKSMRESFEEACDIYLDSKEYKDGNKMMWGYVLCCDMLGFCGMSGWVIFLIILLVLGALAGVAAAFWFFYWKRKN